MNGKANKAVGKPMDRVDGRLKVTGEARYAAELPIQNLTHGVLVLGTIARGRIVGIDTRAAERSPSILAVIKHLNALKLPFKEAKPRAFCDGLLARGKTKMQVLGTAMRSYGRAMRALHRRRATRGTDSAASLLFSVKKSELQERLKFRWHIYS